MAITIFVQNQSGFYSRMRLAAPIFGRCFEQSFAAGAGFSRAAAVNRGERAKKAACLGVALV
ncbi:hypothetical protein EMEDMD4_150141 [Sinorhizobium medicae]|uniref:Uncharacterized protein n=1 Tax=Sinorhizobium medicae TaxID=110321 RepID=A0A508WSA8_9HYPH|nr:hypothetical protein EMEDMD4_150141 [Sinorhizobium medicae]